MRFSKIIWKISPALLVMAALILIAGAAAGQFYNQNDIIKPDDKYKGTSGDLAAVNFVNGTSVKVECSDLVIDYNITCTTTHPDKVNILKHQGKVDQKKKGNNATATFYAEKLASNALITPQNPFDKDLLCEKVQMKGKSNSKNDKMDLKCTFKKCKLPKDLTEGDIEDAGECAEDNAAIGKEAVSLKLRKSRIIGRSRFSGNIRSKGTQGGP